jgi:hypothetical protein
MTLAYGLGLLLLGPYSALEGRGRLDYLPAEVRVTPYYLTTPAMAVPLVRSIYDDYLLWWYCDPNEADRPTGWI